MPLHVSSTVVLIIRRLKFYYTASDTVNYRCDDTASGIITPVGGRPVHMLRESSLNLCTGRPPTQFDDTRCCIIQF